MKTKLNKLIILLIVLAAIPTIVIFGKTDDIASDINEKKTITIVGETANVNNVSTKRIELNHGDKKCYAELTLTPYAMKETLSSDSLAILEAAYKSIEECESFKDLNEGIEEYATKSNATIDDIIINDIFDLSINYSDGFPTEHKTEFDGLFNVELSTEDLSDFICLLHYVDGEWKVISGATISGANHNTLSFHANSLSPFAVVTISGEVYKAVDTSTR